MAPPAALPARLPIRIAVASDQQLIAEAVVAALRTRSFDALLIRWPDPAPDPVQKAQRRRAPRRAVGRPPDVGLLVSDLARMEQVHGAQTLLGGLQLPWLVMAGVEPGPAWGGLYEQGAGLVVPSDTGLDTVCDLLVDLVAGRQPSSYRTERRERRAMIAAWHVFAAQRQDLTGRLRTLSEREEEILNDLHQGFAVRVIAERSEVAEATVRGQVKAILKKLEVNSQMAAVAVYEDVLTDSTIVDADPLDDV
jgi:DNA-binding NarL/FixJ family response regulator